MKRIKTFPLELVFWVIALVLLATANGQAHHFSLCPLANLGYEEWCPGCGLGRSIIHILHGAFVTSFAEHWFGFPALLIILFRIFTLITKNNNLKLQR